MLGGKIYLSGGLGRGGALAVYDPALDSWTSLPPAPSSGTGWLAAFVADPVAGVLHRVGGEGAGGEHFIYDPVAGAWSAAAPAPSALVGAAAFWPAGGDAMVLLMGEYESEPGGVPPEPDDWLDSGEEVWCAGPSFALPAVNKSWVYPGVIADRGASRHWALTVMQNVMRGTLDHNLPA